jgi:hypothetical protein
MKQYISILLAGIVALTTAFAQEAPGAADAETDSVQAVQSGALAVKAEKPAQTGAVAESAKPEIKLFTIRAEMAADPLFIRSFFGDYAERKPSVNVGNAPFLYQGEGSIKSFQSSGFVNGMAGRVRFSYEDDLVGGLLELRSMNEMDYGWVNNAQYVRYGALGDWNLWARLFNQRLRILAGNTAQRGQVSSFSSFDGFVKNNVSSLGILYPNWRRSPKAETLINNLNIRSTFPYTKGDTDYNMGFAEFSSADTLDLFYPASMTGRQQLGFLVDGVFAPVTVSLSAGGLFSQLTYPFKTPWNAGDSTRLSDYDSDFDPVEVTGMNFGVRLEGAKIADMVTVAAVYKYSESGLSKLTAKTNDTLKFLLDESNGSHSFGLFATIRPLASLGVTVGWSGLTQFWQNPDFYNDYDLDATTNGADHVAHWLSRYKEVRFPFYNGIDLRLQYTGIEQFTFTFNNNVSFASVNGADHTTDAYSMYVSGWAYTDNTGLNPPGTVNREDWKESYLGLFNALAAEYAVSGNLTATVQAANRLGTFTLDRADEAAAVTSVTNSLSLYAGVNYRIAGRRELVRFTIRTGFACNLNSYLYQFTAAGEPIQRAGYVDYGIPLSLALTF